MVKDIVALPHQKKFIYSTDTSTGLVAGFGAGKSFAGVLKTIIKKLEYPTVDVAYYLPTYADIRDIAIPKFSELLEDLGIPYKINKSDKDIYVKDRGKILLRNMSQPEGIVGYEVGYSLIDECDILPLEKMQLAYIKILGRNRSVLPDGSANQTDVVGTPEGFKWFYKTFYNTNKRLIQAKTTDNRFLPVSFIDTLKENYTETLLQAYLNGEFVNLTSGTVYNHFDRTKHVIDVPDKEYMQYFIGQDFNIGGCISTVFVEEDGKAVMIDEVESKDTFEIITKLAKYKEYAIIYPDSSSKSTSTNASSSDFDLLTKAGYKLFRASKNPFIKDRVNMANKLFSDDKIRISSKCRKTIEALEQQAYDDKGHPIKEAGAGTKDDYTDSFGYAIYHRFKNKFTDRKQQQKQMREFDVWN